MRRVYRLPVLCAVLLAILSGVACLGQQPSNGPMLREGQKAPDLELPGVGWERVAGKKTDVMRLKDFEGKKNVVLFFYPKAMTLG